MRKEISLLVAAAALAFAPRAGAAPTKDECVDAHSRGQDLREEGKLARARQLFMTCAQSACPALVQADCARFGDELARLVPSISFAARDARANDLPNTAVYVDEQLVATRLDEGKSHDVDPGKHAVRFVHDGKEVTVRVVVNQGEKGRNVIATFADAPAATPAAERHEEGVPPPPEPRRPVFPLVVTGFGIAAAATGAALLAVGLGKVPSSCSTSTKECAAPPGDKAFDDAHSGISMANLGVGIGITGAVLAASGLIWYFTSSPQPARVGAAPGGLRVVF